MAKLTKAEYVAEGGTCCPNCGSQNIEGGSFDVDAGYCSQEVGCNDCDASWYDTYELTGYANLEVG